MLSDINHMPLDNHRAQAMACPHRQDIPDCASPPQLDTLQTMKFTLKTHTLSNQNVSIQPFINQLNYLQATVHTVNHKQLPFKHTNKPCNSIKIHINHMIKPSKTINWLFKPTIGHTQHHKHHKLHQHRHTVTQAAQLLPPTIGARTLDKSEYFTSFLF